MARAWTKPSPADAGREGFRRVFSYLDQDGDGKLSQEELRICLRAVGELSEEQAELLLEGDTARSVEFDEFMRLVGLGGGEKDGEERGSGSSSSSRSRELREAFGVFEMEGTGCITPVSLRRALAWLDRPRSLEECVFMINRFDADGNGVLSFDEFCSMMD